jgi:hypothetical protein
MYFTHALFPSLVTMIPELQEWDLSIAQQNNGLRYASFSSNQWMDVIWLLGHLLSFFV